MLKHVLFASAALALLAAPSLAADGSIDVTGTVAKTCNLAYNSGSVTFDVALNASTGVNVAQDALSATLAPGVSYCNSGTATVSITVPALTGPTPDDAHFTNIIPYSITLPGFEVGGTPVGPIPSRTTAYSYPVGAFYASLTGSEQLKVTTAPASGPVAAGAYSAIVTITLTP